MKRWLVVIAATLPFVILVPSVSAHFPATDGAMTVILHVDPDDAPVATQPAILNFIFDDTAERFQLADCACSLSVSEQGKPLYFSALSAPTGPSVYGAAAPFVFPRADVYQIAVTGQPVQAGEFQPFNVSWNFRVENPTQPSSFSYSSFFKYFGGILGALLIVGAAVFIFDRQAKK
jgi:hypothetical protein